MLPRLRPGGGSMNNPVIERELTGMLRRGRTLAVQVIFASVLAAAVVLAWPHGGNVSLTGAQSQQVFRLFSYALLLGALVIAPAFPAVSLVREKQVGTLALLLNSPLTPRAIFAGKLLGAVGFILMLVVLSLPAAAACYAMGGVSLTGQIVPVYLILIAAAVQYCAIALYMSLRARRVDGALRLAYAAVFVLAVITMVPAEFTQGSMFASVAAAGDWVGAMSPLTTMAGVLGQGVLTNTGTLTSSHTEAFLVISLCVTLFFSLLTIRRLGQRLFDQPRAAGKITDDRSGGVRFFRRVMYLWFFDPQRRSGLTGPLANPVFVKELRTSRFGRSHWLMRLVGLCLVVSLGLMLAAAYGAASAGSHVMGMILVLLQAALIVLITPGLAGGLISSEVESGSWQLLQMTPLSPRRIVTGKILSSLWTLFLLLLATVPGYLAMLVIDTSEASRVGRVLTALAVTALFALLTASAISAMFRKAATSTGAAYGFLLVVCVGTLAVWQGRGTLFGFKAVRAALLINPLAATLAAIGAPGFTPYQLIPANWYIMAVAGVLAVGVMVVCVWRLTKPR